MNFSGFLKDKMIFILLQLFLMIFITTLFNVYKINIQASYLAVVFIVITTATTILYEYFKKGNYYKRLYDVLDGIDKKQYIAEFLEFPDFIEAEILCDILKQTTKAMNDQIAVQKNAEEEYRDYIETWIHEIKLPISCIDLICKNNSSDVTESISQEVSRIDNFVEQALFYARSSVLEKDYIINKIKLDELVKLTIKKHSKELISSKVNLNLGSLEFEVYADYKWMDFILGQIISNSIKYKREIFKLSFSAIEKNNQVVLIIKDNGIGIAERDLGRVFQKGFTGGNGRQFAKSTGIGLYLCKKMCNKMNLKIEVFSIIGEGTSLHISFPKDNSIIL